MSRRDLVLRARAGVGEENVGAVGSARVGASGRLSGLHLLS